PGHGFKGDSPQYRLTWLILESHIFEAHITPNVIEVHNALRIDVFWLFCKHFVHPVEARKSLGDLSADTDHHEYRRHHKTQVKCKSEKIADGHLAGQNHPASNDHHGYANDAHQQSRSQTNNGCGKERPPDILKEAKRSGFEDSGLPFFRMKAFDHAHTGKRFRQTPGYLRVDFSPLAENRPDRFECFAQNQAEDEKKAERQNRKRAVDSHEQSKRNYRREQPADEVDESSPNQIAYTFDIRHDARNQRSSLICIVIAHG